MILVIGYGNTLRSDDGVGPHIAQEVVAQGWPGVRTIVVHQLMPELAAELAEVSLVIFVDAAEGSGQEAVQVLDITVQADAMDEQTEAPMTHHVTPQSLLQLAQLLYGRCPHATLVSVTGVNFGFGEHLSMVALQNAEVALRLIGTQVVNDDLYLRVSAVSSV